MSLPQGPKGTFLSGPLRNKEQKRSLRGWFANLPLSKDPDYVEYYNDFLVAQNYSSSDWTTTNTGTPTIALASNALGGALSVATDTTSSAITSSQQTQSTWLMAVGQRLWFEASVQVADITGPDVFIGLVQSSTGPLTANDRAGFRMKASDGNGQWYCESFAGGTGASTAAATSGAAANMRAVNSTYQQLSMYWDGVATLKFYINRIKVGEVSANTPTAALRITRTLGVISQTMLIDYFECVMERTGVPSNG